MFHRTGTPTVQAQCFIALGHRQCRHNVASHWDSDSAGSVASHWDSDSAGSVASHWDSDSASSVASHWDTDNASSVASQWDTDSACLTQHGRTEAMIKSQTERVKWAMISMTFLSPSKHGSLTISITARPLIYRCVITHQSTYHNTPIISSHTNQHITHQSMYHHTPINISHTNQHITHQLTYHTPINVSSHTN